MRMPRVIVCVVRFCAAPLLLAGAAGAAAPVTAAAAVTTSPLPAGSPAIRGSLLGVTATSARSAWAVGQAGKKTLILHWNGTAWK
jgi:hypothetical protein